MSEQKVQAVALLNTGKSDWFTINYTPSDKNLPFEPPKEITLTGPAARRSPVAPDKIIAGKAQVDVILVCDDEEVGVNHRPRLLIYRETGRRFEEESLIVPGHN